MKRKHELKCGGAPTGSKADINFDETKSTFSKVSGSKKGRTKLSVAAQAELNKLNEEMKSQFEVLDKKIAKCVDRSKENIEKMQKIEFEL